jgi:hypothetical protein
VTHEEPGVHAQVALESVEVLLEGGPVPVDALLERCERHALHLGHHPAHVVTVARLQRGQREPAVAGDDGGDPVEGRRRGRRIPEELGVVVRVRVDEPGGQHAAGRVELLGVAGRNLARLGDRRDAAGRDDDVGDPAGGTRAVHDRGVADDQVGAGLVHVESSLARWTSHPTGRRRSSTA